MIKVTPVILCGGSGTRLWPLSRNNFPKPFVPLIGGKSLLQLTLERVALINPDLIIIDTTGYLSRTRSSALPPFLVGPAKLSRPPHKCWLSGGNNMNRIPQESSYGKPVSEGFEDANAGLPSQSH